MKRKAQPAVILSALRRKNMTRHQLAAATEIPLETVCRRVRALEDSGHIEEYKRALCHDTGQNRGILRIKKKHQRVA